MSRFFADIPEKLRLPNKKRLIINPNPIKRLAQRAPETARVLPLKQLKSRARAGHVRSAPHKKNIIVFTTFLIRNCFATI
jgi:hypothetical protein